MCDRICPPRPACDKEKSSGTERPFKSKQPGWRHMRPHTDTCPTNSIRDLRRIAEIQTNYDNAAIHTYGSPALGCPQQFTYLRGSTLAPCGIVLHCGREGPRDPAVSCHPGRNGPASAGTGITRESCGNVLEQCVEKPGGRSGKRQPSRREAGPAPKGGRGAVVHGASGHVAGVQTPEVRSNRPIGGTRARQSSILRCGKQRGQLEAGAGWWPGREDSPIPRRSMTTKGASAGSEPEPGSRKDAAPAKQLGQCSPGGGDP